MATATHNCNGDDTRIAAQGFSPRIFMCVIHLVIGVVAALAAIGGVAIYLAVA
jgi:hypothetical protein